MLVFVVPLKSRKASKSWEKVCQLFERTVKSICNQTSDQFRAVIVCHDKPSISFHHPHITYLEVDFPTFHNMDYEQQKDDQRRKVAIGQLYAAEFNPSHTMKVDADDLISNRLVEFVEKHPKSYGWYFESGYEYEYGKNFIYLRSSNFYRHCGTSNILRYDLWEWPKNPEELDSDSLFQSFQCHVKTREIMAKKNTPVTALPFPGAIYNIKHGENLFLREVDIFKAIISPKESTLFLKSIYKRLKSQALSVQIRNEFAIDN